MLDGGSKSEGTSVLLLIATQNTILGERSQNGPGVGLNVQITARQQRLLGQLLGNFTIQD